MKFNYLLIAVILLASLLIAPAGAAAGDTLFSAKINVSENFTVSYAGTPVRAYAAIAGNTSVDNVDVSKVGQTGDASFYSAYGWAQQISPTKSQITGVTIPLKKAGGSPTGNLLIEIVYDNAGYPTGNVLASNTFDVSTLTTSYGYYNISLPCIYNGTGKLWVVGLNQTAWSSVEQPMWGDASGTYADKFTYTLTSSSNWVSPITTGQLILNLTYAKNTEAVNVTVNGNTSVLDTGDATGLLSGATVDTYRGFYNWTLDFSSIGAAAKSVPYTASFGARTDATGIIYNGWGFSGSNSLYSTSTSPQNMTYKIVSPLPFKDITISGTIGYDLDDYIGVSSDNVNYIMMINGTTGGLPPYKTNTTSLLAGNKTIYVKYISPTAAGFVEIQPIKVNATINTTTSNQTVLLWQNGVNTVNITSYGNAVSSSLDPSLKADVWLIEGESVNSITADYTISNSSGIEPLLTHFTDTSTVSGATIDSWNWSFGDGQVSSTQSPDHTFINNGTYSVNLTITNTSYSLASTKLATVTVFNQPPVANFTASNTSGMPPLLVQFTDTSTGDNITLWNWSFGDGNISSLQNPQYTFENVGEYQVNLTVVNDGGSSTKLKNITVALFGAYFTANVTSGPIPLAVQFTDTSIGNYDTWNWSVDDGTLQWFNKTIYADRNLEYTFNNVGSWRVNLSVQNISEAGPIYSTSMNITATNVPPVASFTNYPSAGSTSTVFIFNDTSTGIITTRNWSFGDGNYSSIQNVTHIFPSNGVYNVNLTISNGGGSSFVVHTITISTFSVSTTISPASGAVPLFVTFNDSYTGLIPDSYLWEFGDGATATTRNATHTYTTIGSFNVNHRAVNDSTTVWSNTTGAVTVAAGSINASFTSNVTSGNYILPVRFTDTTTNVNATPNSYYWVFGDGGVSALQNPLHSFTSAGNYSVNLTVTNITGGVSNTSPGTFINVSTPSGVFRQDLYLSKQYTLTVTFKDADTGSIVPYVLVSDSLGNEQNATYGTYSQTYDYSVVTIYYSATGYAAGSRTYSMSQDRTVTIELTPVGKSTYTQSVWWTPHTVQITLMDSVYQNRLTGIPINASFNKSAIPVEWLNQMYGIQEATALQMLNKNLYLTGITGSDGTLTTTLLGSLEYDIHLDLSSRGGSTDYFVQAYPSDSMLNIYVPIAGLSFPGITNTNQTQRLMVSNVTEPNLSYVTMWNYYQDPTGMTSQVNMDWRFANNNTVIQWVNASNPGTSLVIGNYTMQNTRGTQIWWGINATLIDN